MRAFVALGSLAFFACGCFGQPGDAPAFAVASVKKSLRVAGRDARGPMVAGAGRLSARNVSLKDLLLEAYHLQRYQVSGPGWFDSDEFDVEAKADGPVDREHLRLMLQKLLTERFRIKMRTESKEVRVLALVVDKQGPKIHPKKDEERSAPGMGQRSFHGELQQLANLLSVQLTIPSVPDPGRPSVASGAPVPVVDKTGLAGIYDFSFDFRPEADSDMFQIWQRILQDQLGLRLENQRAKVDFLVVERAERVPIAN